MKTTLVLLLAVCAGARAPGQSVDEPWEPNPVRRAIESEQKKIPEESTAVGLVVGFSFSAYRFLLSDQQRDICAFLPSCSNYSRQAFDLHGPILGLIMTVDRLERCNWSAWSYAGRYYPVTFHNGKMMLSDSVCTSSRSGDEQK
ncbi:MAG: membrane protein insertion efficiency factor YidD [bacterium]